MADFNIYCAGPIDLGKDIPNWRDGLRKAISATSKHSAVIFDPSTSYKVTTGTYPGLPCSTYIEEVNKMALQLADIFVVCLPAATASVGTPIEIDMAHKADKSIFILTDIPYGKSVYLNNRIPLSNWFHFSDQRDFEIALLQLVDCLGGTYKRAG